MARIFQGTISSSNSDITLQLTQDLQGHVNGKYFYGKNKRCLYLEGSSALEQADLAPEETPASLFSLREQNEFGQLSGLWNIRYENGVITGSWNKNIKNKAAWVELQEMDNTYSHAHGASADYTRLPADNRKLGGSAFIRFIALNQDLMFYTGNASWIPKNNPGGTSVGDVHGTVSTHELSAWPARPFFNYDAAGGADCQLVMRKRGDLLDVEDNGLCGGQNVSFNGTYKRTGRH